MNENYYTSKLLLGDTRPLQYYTCTKIKTKDEFTVQEAEFTGGHPENVKFEETVDFRYGDHGSDFSEVERYAIGKNKDKKIIGKQAKSDAWAEGRAESAADEVDYASGGLARMLGE